METNVLDERLKFVADYESGQLARHRASGRAGWAWRVLERHNLLRKNRRHRTWADNVG
jgi:hypothetical protein